MKGSEVPARMLHCIRDALPWVRSVAIKGASKSRFSINYEIQTRPHCTPDLNARTARARPTDHNQARHRDRRRHTPKIPIARNAPISAVPAVIENTESRASIAQPKANPVKLRERALKCGITAHRRTGATRTYFDLSGAR
jgi:hypothetical protein